MKAISIFTALFALLSTAFAADPTPGPSKLPNLSVVPNAEIFGECDLKPGASKAFTVPADTAIKIGFDSKLAKQLTTEDFKKFGPVKIRFIRTDGGEGDMADNTAIFGELEPRNGKIQFKVENGLPIQAHVFIFVARKAKEPVLTPTPK